MSEPIYPYIPFASSLVWNRCKDPDDSPMKIHVSFSPDWFTRRMDLDYGRRWHRDPLYRRDTFVAMAKALDKEFPELHLGGEYRLYPGGLSQINTCALVAALFDQDILYFPDQWPENKGVMLDDSAVESLGRPDLRNHPVYSNLMDQMDLIEREWGLIEGELNYQGVLNTAFRLRGQQIFSDMIAAPERAHKVLDVVCRTMLDLVDGVYARQAETGIKKDYFVTSNCVVNMISGQHYQEFVLPYDRLLAEHFDHFGIHNCGWNVDAYADAYAQLPPLGYLDFGIESDLEQLKTLFPTAILTVILNPTDILGKTETEMTKLLEKIRRSLGSCRLIVGSLDGSTKPAEINRLFYLASEIWSLPVELLVPTPYFG